MKGKHDERRSAKVVGLICKGKFIKIWFIDRYIMHFFHSALSVIVGTLCLAGQELPASEPSLPSTLKPEPHRRDPYNWQARHEAVKQLNRMVKPEYVVIGDSITHHWGGEPSAGSHRVNPASWQKLFGSHAAVNMGFGFDYADNAYYRVQDGELNGISPRVVILLLGTNNLGHRKDSPQACADNMGALVRLIQGKCPSAKILLLGILPRKEPHLAEPIKETNRLLAKLQNGKTVFFANPGKALLAPDGVFPRNDCMRDTVHPNAKGYDILAHELSLLLKKLDKKYSGGKGGKLP